MNKEDMKKGTKVNYHGVIGGPVTMEGVEIIDTPWNSHNEGWLVTLGSGIGIVSLKAVSFPETPPTKTLKFSGHSDDTFGEYETFKIDHDNCAADEPIVFEVGSKSQNVHFWVIGEYAARKTMGAWMIGIQIDEDVPLPAWPMKYETAENSYSPELVIEAPKDVTVTLCKGDHKE